MGRIVIVSAALFSWSICARAQTSPLASEARFDVASVKPHASGDSQVAMVAQPGGRFVATNVPLRLLIRTAYQIQNEQIVGGPEWLDTDRFDIDARSQAGEPPSQAVMRLQSLLSERFRLVTHRENRELPVYALRRLAADSSGHDLKPTMCPPLDQDPSGPTRCAAISTGPGRLTLRGMPMTQFVPWLGQQLDRVVIDQTNLDARYDIDLQWQAEDRGGVLAPDGIPLVTAVREQLGLRLDPVRAPVSVLIIDSVERPAPD